MFSNPHHLGSRRPFSSSYQDVNASTAIEGATPHKLVSLLFQAIASDIAAARGAIGRKDVAAKGKAISHAVRVIEEGLLSALDVNSSGALGQNLRDVYEYMVQRLTMANLRTDDTMLAECARLNETLREGWEAIADRSNEPVRTAAA